METTMETTIKSTTINTVEAVTTDNATYDLNVTRLNGMITKVSATIIVQSTATEDSGVAVVEAKNIGTVVYSAGNLSIMNIPADSRLPVYISELLDIIETIKARE